MSHFMEWQGKAMVAASNDPEKPARPLWTGLAELIPSCADDCPHHDGKRCELTGFRPGSICAPVVAEMANILTMARTPADIARAMKNKKETKSWPG